MENQATKQLDRWSPLVEASSREEEVIVFLENSVDKLDHVLDLMGEVINALDIDCKTREEQACKVFANLMKLILDIKDQFDRGEIGMKQ